ncbi:N-carbamoylputrescine amidase [Ectothiorhodosinus mongolicus]|uniref:N-carbamoylputrescine amidase n=1 Tax=Ectothiorhodosinus mongolicus TaxID=233100 RepID=A0A1R3W8L8_9GAMM|nr:carbon-nitrogen hydrolase [Ectothiorhodosinus mongolicus]ULX57644.1 acyltransferase [Ectothiorhodosinus mongolicus]SIT73261.1 N-carbamoylputrescine amidase [Ectothiorhodosinus mongolicus]
MRTALIQQQNSDDIHANLDKTLKAIDRAAEQEVRLVVLQELHTGPYFCQTEDPHIFDLAEPIPGPTTEILSKKALQHGIVIVASLFERRAPGLYHNTAVVLESDGSIAGIYRKMHIPDDPGYYEKFYFTPGDLGFQPIQTSIGRLGVLVCWDQWFPEAARLMAMAGAELLIYPTAIGWDPSDTDVEQQRQREAWITVQRGHAIANGLHTLVCNRVGFEADPSDSSGGSLFWGSSFVCGPQGEMLAQAPSDDEAIIVTDISLARSEQVRRIWPFLRDRRIDAYSDLNQRYLDARQDT